MWVVQTGQASLGTEPGKTDKTAPVLRAQRATFTGLIRGTTYYYQAFAGEAGRGSFKTPPMGEAQFQFVVYGDTRTRHEVHREVIASVLKYSNPDFVLHTGDLVADGNVPSMSPISVDAGRRKFKSPPMGEAQFQFVVYGDTRTRHEVHREVIASVLKYSNPDFVLHTGDLVAD